MRRHLWLLSLIGALVVGLLTPLLYTQDRAAQSAPVSSAGSGIDLEHSPLALVSIAVTGSSQKIAFTPQRFWEPTAPVYPLMVAAWVHGPDRQESRDPSVTSCTPLRC
jgi:hypothetical protein